MTCLARRQLGGRCWVDGSATDNNVPRAPRYTDAHMALALLNDLLLLNFKAAERGYRDTIALDPARPSCHYNLGVLIYGKVSGSASIERAIDGVCAASLATTPVLNRGGASHMVGAPIRGEMRSSEWLTARRAPRGPFSTAERVTLSAR